MFNLYDKVIFHGVYQYLLLHTHKLLKITAWNWQEDSYCRKSDDLTLAIGLTWHFFVWLTLTIFLRLMSFNLLIKIWKATMKWTPLIWRICARRHTFARIFPSNEIRFPANFETHCTTEASLVCRGRCRYRCIACATPFALWCQLRCNISWGSHAMIHSEALFNFSNVPVMKVEGW